MPAASTRSSPRKRASPEDEQWLQERELALRQDYINRLDFDTDAWDICVHVEFVPRGGRLQRNMCGVAPSLSTASALSYAGLVEARNEPSWHAPLLTPKPAGAYTTPTLKDDDNDMTVSVPICVSNLTQLGTTDTINEQEWCLYVMRQALLVDVGSCEKAHIGSLTVGRCK